MNTKQDKALQLALEALEIEEAQTHYPSQWLLKAITAIRVALASKSEALSLVNKVDQEQPAQQQEIDELTAQRDKLADILTRTANALKGQPPELVSHSWHDLPEVVQQLKSAQQQKPVGRFTGSFRAGDGRMYFEVACHSDQPLPALMSDIYTSPQPAQQQEPVGEAYLCDKCQTPFDGAYYCPEYGQTTLAHISNG